MTAVGSNLLYACKKLKESIYNIPKPVDFLLISCKLFQIYIEHKLVAKFAYYVPISNISHIYINGDVELYTVSWEGKYYVSSV